MKLRTWCIRIGQILTKTVLVFTGFLVFLTLFCAASIKAESGRGGITIRQQNVPIEKVFQSIEKQSGYRFFYNETLLQGAGKVTINLQNVSLQEALDACFHNQPLSYAIVDKTIIVKKRPDQRPQAPVAAAVSLSKPGKIIALRGKVTSGSVPVVGASIMIKGTDNGASTDKEGMFTLPEVEDDATLVVSSVSHSVREVRLNGQTFISIDLAQRTDDLDEAVVVAYNTTTRRMNTGAVTVVKGAEIQNLPNRSFEKSLQGLVPGLLITQGTGQPGGGVANFVLRGIATGADPSNGTIARQPLVVMDGIPLFQDPIASTSLLESPNNNPLAQLNPSDIESITVLKDASAIALYGSRASNGVILVTTKKGKEGKTRIGIRHQTDIADRLKGNQEMLNQDEYLELLYETYKNTNQALYTDAVISEDLKKKFPVMADGSFYAQTDWLNELYRQNAITVANELSVSGGTSRQTFYLNLENTRQNGIEKNTGFDRKSIRFNFDSRPNSWLKLGINTTASYTVQNVGMGNSESGAARISPLNPVRDEYGEFLYNFQWGGATSSDLTNIGSYFPNPAANQTLNINRNISYRGLTRLSGEAKFLRYFSFTTLLGLDFMLTESKLRIHPKLSEGYGFTANAGNIVGRNSRVANLITTNSLRFNKQWANRHTLDILAAHEAQIRNSGVLGISLTGISNNPLTEELQTGTVNNASGVNAKETLLSYFGQANYGFLKKYFLSASVRRDGSSLFGENNQFGTHWSIGGGWVVNSEGFMRFSRGWLDYLKLRGSVGSAGNSAAIINTMRYHRLQLINFINATAILPDPSFAPNPGIKWEKTFTWNAGADIRVLKERLSVSVDVYSRKTTDLLGSIVLPPANGYTGFRTNIGNLRNTGLELSFSASIIKSKNFHWNIAANWSKNRNRLIRSAFPLETSSGSNPQNVNSNSITVNAPGKNYNSFYLVQWAGVDPETGRPLWVDSTGKLSSTWAAAKPVFAGKSQPDGFGSLSQSFSWKSFTLNMMFNYQYGFQVYADATNNPLVNDGMDPFINQGKSAMNRWRKPGDIADNPRRLLFGKVAGSNTSDNSTANSTRYLIDGDFIRLSNVSLSYQLPRQLTQRLKLGGANVYIQGNNLATWTKYSGRQDPENASAMGRISSVYPLQRSWSLGLNLNL